MLILKQFNGKSIRDIGYYDSLEDVFNGFYSSHGGYGLEKRFSFNPYEIYHNDRFIEKYNFSTRKVDYIFVPKVYCYIIETDNGVRYSKEYIEGMFRIFRKEIRKDFRWYIATGRKWHHRGTYFRHPQTLQERREIANVYKDDGEPEFRGKRRNIRHSWDDVVHKDVDNRNWKRFRKTQYK